MPAGPMPMRTLGSTGVSVSAIGLGGFHMGSQLLESESIKNKTSIQFDSTTQNPEWLG